MAKSYLDENGLLYFWQKIKNLFAPKESPVFTGVPKAPTATSGDNSTQIATTAFVADAIESVDVGLSDAQVNGTSIVTDGVANLVPATMQAWGVVKAGRLSTQLVDDHYSMLSLTFGASGGGTTTVRAALEDLASASGRGLMSPTHYSKLEGIASGAEVNVLEGVQMNGTDLAISSKKVNIPTFTGATTSAAGSVGLVPAPAKSIAATNPANKRYLAGNGSWTLLPIQSFNDTTYNNVSVLQFTDSSGQATHRAIGYGALGAASGVCPLDANSKVDASYLPSYVDDVIEAYARSGQTALSQNWLSTTSGGVALTPEAGKIYVLMADSGDYAANTQFRWGGSAYVKLNDGGVTEITNSEIDTIVAS